MLYSNMKFLFVFIQVQVGNFHEDVGYLTYSGKKCDLRKILAKKSMF